MLIVNVDINFIANSGVTTNGAMDGNGWISQFAVVQNIVFGDTINCDRGIGVVINMN
ncbi:hypothetical protein D3C75_693480 [compost metagenome]